jgi:hypothetical protein
MGKYTTEMDRALPGKHKKLLYDSFKCTEAIILAQLRTGMARLNEYLHRIGASESDQCACGQASESLKHFLFQCTQWDRQRHQWDGYKKRMPLLLPGWEGAFQPGEMETEHISG